MSQGRPDPPRLRLDPASHETLGQQILRRDGWRAARCRTWNSTTKGFAAILATTPRRT